jgi:hypothetical protein
VVETTESPPPQATTSKLVNSANATAAKPFVGERRKLFDNMVGVFLSVIHLTMQWIAATSYPLPCGVLCSTFNRARIVRGCEGGNREAHHR